MITKLEKVNALSEMSNVKRLSELSYLYRIRTGDYRLIVKYDENSKELILSLFLVEYLKRNEKTYEKYK